MDNNWKYDIDRMIYLEVIKDIRVAESANKNEGNDSYTYWIASRFILEEYNDITYYAIESTWAQPMFYISNDYAGAEGGHELYGVRPIVSVSAATLNSLLGGN